jgi:hypothetical protein
MKIETTNSAAHPELILYRSCSSLSSLPSDPAVNSNALAIRIKFPRIGVAYSAVQTKKAGHFVPAYLSSI